MSDGHILIVEEDDVLSEGLVAYLQMQGFSADHARDGQEGIKAIQRKTPDLIVCAQTIRPGSGLSLLKVLRENSNTQDLPFVLISSQDGRVPEESRKRGADAIFMKPFNLRALADKIEELLSEH